MDWGLFLQKPILGKFSIDLLPAHCSMKIQQSKQVFRCIFKTVIYLVDEIWGQPSSEQFFGISFPSDSSYYQQWSSSVDVAAFIPLVFLKPSQYESGVPQQSLDNLTDTRLGAVWVLWRLHFTRAENFRDLLV